jgi:hypothetical protein
MNRKPSPNDPIPYVPVDDQPIPYRVRVLPPSPWLRSAVVPRLGIRSVRCKARRAACA